MGHLFSAPRICRWLLFAVVLTISLFALAADDYDQQMSSAPTTTQSVVAPSPPLIPLVGSSAADLEHQGDLLRGQKRYFDAIDYYHAALAQGSTPLRYNKLGMAYLFLQQYKDAQKSFDHSLKLDKDCAEAWNNIGFVEQMKRNYGKASKYYEHALAIRPDSPTFHYNMGSVYFARHKYPEAAQEYRTAYMLDPDIFNRVSRMGILAQTSSPEDRAAFSFMVARMYAEAGDVDHCIEYLRKAMEEGYRDIKKVYTESDFATLRTDKRFTELMEQRPQPLP
jgi:tetratricopeptide (TPR) repeat protein